MWYLTDGELDAINQMDAEWQEDLERKGDIILSSIRSGFSFAFGPLFVVKNIADIPSFQREKVVERIKMSLSQSCAINSYENKLKVLDAYNVFPVDYSKFVSMREYDTVSYIFNDEDDEKSIILAFKMKA